ncbi:MAG: nitrilase-related carbon-nitrogen hydrolase [Lentisphaeria bacterium]|nr:nitrilase-related carbon-nitrogen hydrolase [Lentisphaeria bacterium]
MMSLKTALVQMSSGPDLAENMAHIHQLTDGLPAVDLVILPECALCRSGPHHLGQEARTAEEWLPILTPVAEAINAPLVAGGVPVASQGEFPRRIFNSSLIISPDGELLGRYDKMHLFQLTEDEQTAVDETEIYAPGTLPTQFEIGRWRLGLSICYDLRFPELFRQYTPAQAMICTAAFTEQTGRDHWEVLLRARAIENQCYMLGVGQCGEHPTENYRNYGHTMCVDPWGRVIAEAADDPVVLVVDLDFNEVYKVRSRIPALKELQLAPV